MDSDVTKIYPPNYKDSIILSLYSKNTHVHIDLIYTCTYKNKLYPINLNFRVVLARLSETRVNNITFVELLLDLNRVFDQVFRVGVFVKHIPYQTVKGKTSFTFEREFL